MAKLIPLSIPNFEGNEKKYVDDALTQGWVSTGGAYINELEHKLGEYLKVSNVCACQSGTSALHLALMECGVEPDDMVIVPTLTFIAAVNPVKYQFAHPIFMDCDDSLCMDPVKLKRFCKNECTYSDNVLRFKKNERIIKAIVVVHVFGNMADMDAIMHIAEMYNLKVIEDATEALGSYYISGKYNGKYAGTIGDYGAFSFNGNKIITTGGGGAVTAKNSTEVDHMRYKSTQSKDDTHFYIHNEIGFNYRMTNLQAALGVAQMEELSEFIRRKHNNFDLYKKLFVGWKLGKLMPYREDVYSNMWFYSLQIDRSKVKASMREIINLLQERGVQTRAVWGLIHEQKPYQMDVAYKIERAKYYSECILNIPCSTQLTESEITYAAEQIKIVLEELASE